MSRSEPTLDLYVCELAAEEAGARGDVLDPAVLMGKLDALARGVRMPPTCSVPEAVARLNIHLFQGIGFHPAEDDYGLPESSLLDHVLEKRTGVPILMSIVYMEVARRCGFEVDGVGFPGHFLVRPREASPRFFLDPYHQGRVLDEDRLRDQLARVRGRRVRDSDLEAALRPVDDSSIRLRLNNNLKGAWLRVERVDRAIRACERMLDEAPHLPGEQRELALMRVHEGRSAEAVAGLQAYVEAYPEASEAAELLQLAAMLGEAAGAGSTD